MKNGVQELVKHSSIYSISEIAVFVLGLFLSHGSRCPALFTALATGCNIGLNFLLIPRFGMTGGSHPALLPCPGGHYLPCGADRFSRPPIR